MTTDTMTTTKPSSSAAENLAPQCAQVGARRGLLIIHKETDMTDPKTVVPSGFVPRGSGS